MLNPFIIKKNTMKYCTLLITIACISCNNQSSKNQEKQTVDTVKNVVLTPYTIDMVNNKIDPVCNMSIEHATIEDTSIIEGKVYGFCSAGCKDEFKKDPSKYTMALK